MQEDNWVETTETPVEIGLKKRICTPKRVSVFESTEQDLVIDLNQLVNSDGLLQVVLASLNNSQELAKVFRDYEAELEINKMAIETPLIGIPALCTEIPAKN